MIAMEKLLSCSRGPEQLLKKSSISADYTSLPYSGTSHCRKTFSKDKLEKSKWKKLNAI